jgi:hypothetical protein
MPENKKDPMDVDGAVSALNAALRLQFRSALAYTGQEGRSEALEHRLEHVIMRKQEQVDALIRASRAG